MGMGDTHVNFIRPVAPTPRYESSELPNLLRNAAAGLPEKVCSINGLTLWAGWYGFYLYALSVKEQIDWCKRLEVCVRVKG